MGIAVATQARKWTIQEVHRFPDDGNKYELVRGDLFLTPPPTYEHERIGARLIAMLAPYVDRHALGEVFHPRAVMRYRGSEVEPDVMVRSAHPRLIGTDEDWSNAPIPMLVIEIASPYTRRRDREHKKRLYLDAGVAEYWIVEPEGREVHVTRPGAADVVMRDRVIWSPAQASEPLVIEVAALFV